MQIESLNSWDPLKYYEKRIEELKFLQQQAKSKTTANLIENAIVKSNLLLQKNIRVQKQTVAFIHQEKEKYDKSLVLIDEKLNLLNTGLKDLSKLEGASDSQKADAEKYLNKAKAIGQKTKENRIEVMKLQSKVMPETALALQDVLLDLIFKPNSSTFHYDTIMDGLKLIGGLFIPAFDSLMNAKDTPISVLMRKKQYLHSGDRLHVYLEQFLDIMEKWEALADEFIKLVED